MAIDLSQFKRSHCCNGTATASEIADALQHIRQFDARFERQTGLIRSIMVFSLLTMVGAMIAAIAMENAILFLVAIASGVVFFLTIALFWMAKKHDLPNRRYELLEDLVQLLKRDMSKDEPFTVKLDLAAPTSKHKKTGQDKVRDWNVTYFDDPWLNLSGKLSDGTSFEIAMLERHQARRRWKKSRSGKSKLKRKTKSATLTTVNLYPKQKRYTNLPRMANQIGAFVQLPQWSRVKKAAADAKSLKLTSITTADWSVKRTDPKTEFDGKQVVVLMLLSMYQILHVSKPSPA